MTDPTKAGTVAVYVHGDHLEPLTLTELLGTKPDSSWKFGDERLLSSGKVVKAKTGMWTLSVPLMDGDTDHAVAKLIEALGESLPKILSVPGVDSAYADIFICISREQSDAGYTLKLLNSELSAIANAGLDIQVTISVAGN